VTGAENSTIENPYDKQLLTLHSDDYFDDSWHNDQFQDDQDGDDLEGDGPWISQY
jgi:hypothetical protein